MTVGELSGTDTPRETPVASSPGAHDHLVRLRLLIVSAVTAAFVIALGARVVPPSVPEQSVISGTMSFVALSLLCASAVYVIFQLDNVPLLKWTISLATFCLLLSQAVNALEEVSYLQSWFLLNREVGWNNEIKAYATLVGLVLLLATLYLALLETVAVKAALMRERGDLYVEIAERRLAQAALNDSRDQLRRLSAHLENVREDERTRVAREIHDELGQSLTGLKFDLANLRQQLAKTADGRGCEELIGDMSGQIDETVNVVRRIISELRPGILDDLGLDAAVEWQARDFQRRTGVDCKVSVDIDGLEPDREHTTALFRILQEALTNVARHAQASRVEVKLAYRDGRIVLDVVDNGRGLDRAVIDERKSFGLLGIRERVLQLGGEFDVDSAPGRGARITVSLPADRAEVS